jgi:hypothetical protein
MSRFNGSNAIETASFINRRNLNSFQIVDLDFNPAYNNSPSNQSFIVGQQNVHSSSVKATSIGDATIHGAVVSSLTTNYGTSVSNNYDVAMNYINSTSPRIQFRGYSTTVNEAIYRSAALFNLANGAIADNEENQSPDNKFGVLWLLASNSSRLVIYDHNADKLIRCPREFNYDVINVDTNGKPAPDFTGVGISFSGTLSYYDGNPVNETDEGLFSVFLIDCLKPFYQDFDPYAHYKANFTTGIANSVYGVANQANGVTTTAIGYSNQSNGIGSIAIGSGSISSGYNNGVWNYYGVALGAFNASGKNYYSTEITNDQLSSGELCSKFPSIETPDLYNFLDTQGYDSFPTDSRKVYSAIVIIPSKDYCGLVELFADKASATLCSTSLLPTGSSSNNEPVYAYIVLSDNSTWYTSPVSDIRVEPGGNNKPLASTAIGYANRADGTGSFAGGIYSSTRGLSSFAFGNFAQALNNESIAFGANYTHKLSSSFGVGFYPTIDLVSNTTPNLFVQQNFVGVNTNSPPNYGFTGLRVSNDLQVDSNATIVNDLRVFNDTYLGNLGTESTYVSGSLYVNNFTRITGQAQIYGSLIVSNSLNVIGTNIISGNLFVTGSQRNIGTFTNTGSFNISGSVNINGDITVTGLQTIGGNIFLGNQLTDVIRMTGSVNITGSLIANYSYLTGSLTGSFIGTGSGNFNGRFIGVYTGSTNPGVSFFGTASWASQVLTASYVTSSNVFGPYAANSILSSSYSVTSSYSVSSSYSISSSYAVSSSFSLLTSNILGGATNYITVWNSATSLSSSAATDNGSLFSINRNTEVTGTLAINVPSATNQNQPAMQVNNNGLFIIGSSSVTPTAVPGGIYFDGTDFYLGFV